MPTQAWPPKVPPCCGSLNATGAAARTSLRRHASVSLLSRVTLLRTPTCRRTPPRSLRQPVSTAVGCSACALSNASHSPIGASPTNGSPKNCSSAARPPSGSLPSCNAAVPTFHAGILTLRIISTGRSREPRWSCRPPLFPGAIVFSTPLPPLHLARDRAARAPLCGPLMPKSPLLVAPPAWSAYVQTAQATGSRALSAAAFGCRLFPETRRWHCEQVPYSDIQFGIPLHT